MYRTPFLRRLIAGFVAASVMAAMLPVGAARAGLVGTDQIVRSMTVQQDRDRVLAFMARADVRSRLELLGVDPDEAAARVNSLTDEEIVRIAAEIDQMPAGQDAGAVVVIVVAVVLLVLIFTDAFGFTEAFPAAE